VAIVWEQLALVQRVRRNACVDRWRSVFERSIGRSFEHGDVDVHDETGEQCDGVCGEHHCFAGAEHSPRDMGCVAQVRHRGIALQAGPERIAQLVWMHSSVRMHRQELHQRG
jgi:hypothetical protein